MYSGTYITRTGLTAVQQYFMASSSNRKNNLSAHTYYWLEVFNFCVNKMYNFNLFHFSMSN